MPLGNSYTPVVKKDLPYRDEREFRLLLWHWQTDPAQGIDVHAPAVRVPVDLKKLIRHVYINPWRKEVPSVLLELLERTGLADRLCSSVIHDKAV
jgi:hypothetical protein